LDLVFYIKHLDWNLAIEELESTSVEEGGYEEQGKLNEMLEEAKQQKILLSEELRQIIEQDRHSRSVGITGDGPSLLLGRFGHGRVEGLTQGTQKWQNIFF
jgi:hypothetical protein